MSEQTQETQELVQGSVDLPVDAVEGLSVPIEEVSVKSLAEIEKDQILLALNFFDGNKTKAANALGISIKTLYNKLHAYGMM